MPSGILKAIRVTYLVYDGPGNPRDFVGIYTLESNLKQHLTWAYLANDAQFPRPLNGVKHGTVHLDLPNPDGTYEIRFVSVISGSPDIFNLEAKSEFNVGLGPIGLVLSAPPGAYIIGPASWSVTDPAGNVIEVSPGK